MPNTPGAAKRMRQSEKRRVRNRSALKSIKNELKNVQTAAKTGSPDQLAAAAKIAIMKLDKAAGKRIVHPNLAARKKSQLARLMNATAAKAKK